VDENCIEVLVRQSNDRLGIQRFQLTVLDVADAAYYFDSWTQVSVKAAKEWKEIVHRSMAAKWKVLDNYSSRFDVRGSLQERRFHFPYSCWGQRANQDSRLNARRGNNFRWFRRNDEDDNPKAPGQSGRENKDPSEVAHAEIHLTDKDNRRHFQFAV
jgi:hypothetical protein